MEFTLIKQVLIVSITSPSLLFQTCWNPVLPVKRHKTCSCPCHQSLHITKSNVDFCFILFHLLHLTQLCTFVVLVYFLTGRHTLLAFLLPHQSCFSMFLAGSSSSISSFFCEDVAQGSGFGLLFYLHSLFWSCHPVSSLHLLYVFILPVLTLFYISSPDLSWTR